MSQTSNEYLTKAVHYYGVLFTFPRYSILIILLLLTSVGGSASIFYLINPTLEGVLKGFVYSFQVFFLPMTIIDVITREFLTKEEAIFDLRRSTSLSLITCAGCIITMAIGALLQFYFDSSLLYYSTVYNVCSTVALRFLVINTATQLSTRKVIVTTVTQPITLFILNNLFWNIWSLQITIVVLFSSIILVFTTYIFIHIINKQGEKVVGIGSIPLFKGFLANWLEGFTYPLEEYFEKLGTTTTVSVNVFSFKNGDTLKAMMVVPNIHPGPFRNMGSSDLPYVIQSSLEKKFGTTVIVQHGLSGHELDLTSQTQCDKVITELLKVNPTFFTDTASKLIRVETGVAKATCQFFGETGLMTLTCAPKSMEDIPLSVGKEVIFKGEYLGVKNIAIIDSHNSLGSSEKMPILSADDEGALISAAEQALNKGLKEDRQYFQVGVSRVFPKEFTISQGMGLGGITALVVVSKDQKSLYLTIDGNNMVSGLREKIIQSVSDLFDECEVLTTDTHIVSAINSSSRGYHPLGEAIDHTRLISLIREVAKEALSALSEVTVSFTKIHVNNVKIIGEEKLLELTRLIDTTINKMRWLAPLIYIPTLIVILLFFTLIR